ncbi:MAG: hypothetical protein KBF14_05840 [Synergistaceae bacterium]|nr:hypothetical protein [Synergistaceae bacterium]
MLRPVENQLVIWNVDQKAQQTKDPNASLAQGLQQAAQSKENEQKSQRVQPSPKTEGEVKIRPDQEKRQKGQQKGGQKKTAASLIVEEEETASAKGDKRAFDSYA